MINSSFWEKFLDRHKGVKKVVLKFRIWRFARQIVQANELYWYASSQANRWDSKKSDHLNFETEVVGWKHDAEKELKRLEQ